MSNLSLVLSFSTDLVSSSVSQGLAVVPGDIGGDVAVGGGNFSSACLSGTGSGRTGRSDSVGRPNSLILNNQMEERYIQRLELDQGYITVYSISF